jgi:hypothetical protein
MKPSINKIQPPEWVTTTDDIVRFANINNNDWNRLKKIPECPKRTPHKGYNLQDIITFIASQKTADLSIRDEKTKKEIELLEIKIANAKNELIEVSKVDALIARHAAQFKSLLYAEFEQLPMQIQGLNIGECHGILEASASRICREMQRICSDDTLLKNE